MVTRGIRNNNPGNIRRGSNWKGLLSRYTDCVRVCGCYDASFCQFELAVYGVRALLYLLRKSYYRKYGLRQVRTIISCYAPPKENNTQSYVDRVCLEMNVKPNDFIDLNNDNFLYRMAFAICFVESGFDLTRDMFDDALDIL